MCAHGDTVILRVLMPAHLSYTGALRWDEKAIDRCIAPIVQALNDAGIYTANCCCGHGECDGEIILHDGRVLTIHASGGADSDAQTRGSYASVMPTLGASAMPKCEYSEERPRARCR